MIFLFLKANDFNYFKYIYKQITFQPQGVL